MKPKDIQIALRNAGFNPGPIDGIIGRKTIAAIKAFQASKGLQVDGIVGKHTMAALGISTKPTLSTADNQAEAVPAYIPWMLEAKRLIGLKEYAGSGNNPVLMEMAQDLDLDSIFKGDDVPWCGLFVAHCIASQLADEPLPQNPLGARNWRKFGQPTQPSLGAIMVFWRVARNGGLGHVGFYAGENETHYFILGGNQGNQVCVAKVSKERFLEARWPSTAQHYIIKRTFENGIVQTVENEA